MTKYGLCQECYESITNPICLECFVKQINHWLKDSRIKPQIKKTLIQKIKQELHNQINFSDDEIICAICKKNEVSICSYCFFLKTSKIIKKLDIDASLKNQFMEIFNYRQWHDDY